MRPLLLAVLALSLLPASASAALTSAGDITHDDQWSRFTLPVTCDEPSCTLPVTISIQRLGKYPEFKPLGAPTVLDTKTVVAGTGQSNVVVETDKVIPAIAEDAGAFWVIFDGADYNERSFGNYSFGDCGGDSPLLLSYSGKGRLYYRADKADNFGRVSGPVTRSTFMAQGSRYEVRDGSVTYRFRGVTYTFAKGARFLMTCTGNTSTAGGAGVLSPMLEAGKVSVKAVKRKMKQPAAWIMTSEGNLGTRARETTSFSVSRRRSVSTLSMQKGKAGTITPWNSATRSPCRAGEKLSVNRKGVIS